MTEPPPAAPGAASSPDSSSDSPPVPPANAEVVDAWRDEVARAGRLSEDPAGDEERLNRLASLLTTEQLRDYSRVARDLEADGDARATAAELLARNRRPEAVPSLEELIASPVPSTRDPRTQGFELALRSRAIEGLATIPGREADESLARLRSRLDERFLVDRLSRAERARRGEVPSPEEQDREALRKLIGEPER